MKGKKWLILSLVLAIVLPASALGAPFIMKALFWRLGDDPAVAVLQGEHWGQILCGILLTASPFIPVVCFLLEQAGVRRARRPGERTPPPELDPKDGRPALKPKR